MAVMSNRTPLGLDGKLGGGPEWERLEFAMQSQAQTQWCWAAVSVSVADFYEGTGNWTQCRMVNEELEQESCCEDGESEACNQPWFLDRALERAGAFAGMEEVPSEGIEPIPGEIGAGRAFCARIGWSGGGGHFVVIDGYTLDNANLAIEDPIFGASDLPAATFRSAYQGTGSWTDSYLTQSP